jgi:hypothetical protein
MNKAPLDPSIADELSQVRSKQRADDDAHDAAQQEREQLAEEEEEEEEQHDTRTDIAAPVLAQPLVVTRHGRAVKKAEAAGKPLNYYGVVSPDRIMPKIVRPHWNSEEYKRRNHLQFRGVAALEAEKQALAAKAAVAAAAAYSSSTLDPIQPDRDSNEVFQLPASWRLQWASSASYRLSFKLVNLPTTSQKFQSFELPTEEFGEQMTKYRNKDIVPKFKLITQSQLMMMSQRYTHICVYADSAIVMLIYFLSACLFFTLFGFCRPFASES